jgi:hypothetical protein
MKQRLHDNLDIPIERHHLGDIGLLDAEKLGVWDFSPVKLVIADTGPINYLLLIGHIEILSALVRNWIAAPPQWLEVHRFIAPADPMPSPASARGRQRP